MAGIGIGIEVAVAMPTMGIEVSVAKSTDIKFAEAAAIKAKELIAEENNPNLKLRVFITGGGCSGFQYGFSFDEEEKEGDIQVEKEGVTLVVDPMSMEYLGGSTVDYISGLEGSQFIVNNPNATSTCGCGSSFSI